MERAKNDLLVGVPEIMSCLCHNILKSKNHYPEEYKDGLSVQIHVFTVKKLIAHVKGPILLYKEPQIYKSCFLPVGVIYIPLFIRKLRISNVLAADCDPMLQRKRFDVLSLILIQNIVKIA